MVVMNTSKIMNAIPPADGEHISFASALKQLFIRNRGLLASLLLLSLAGLFAFRTINSRMASRRTIGADPSGIVYIIVDKSDYELQVYDDEGWYATYPVVFGNKSLGDKMMAGDRKTPEGTFRIISKKPHSKWHTMLMLDYPNKESWDKFNRRKAQGIIPKSASIGGGIAVHGTWPNDNIVVDDYTNWTQGCISMRNDDIDEICAYVRPGTRVTVRR
jgi:murein L,D-transpeptidase YafK